MKKKLTLAMILLVLVLMIIGCAKTPANVDPTPSGSTPGEAEPGKTTPNNFVYAAGTEPTTLDPHFITDVNTARAAVQIYENLVTRNLDGEIEGVLAVEWETSEDGLSWTFKLREGVLFHDGTPFNAEAVKYNIERILSKDTKSPRITMFEMISEVDVQSEYEVTITTEYVFAPFLAQLCGYNLGMISPTAAEQWGEEYGLHPAGTGALKVQTWEPGRSLSFTKFDEYWGVKSTIDTLSFKTVPEDASRVMMMMTGDADVASGIPPIQVSELDADPNVEVMNETGFRTIYFGFNCNAEPFNDVRVRQAISYAIDKNAIIDNLLRGLATYPSGIESTVIAYSAQDLDPYTYNVEKAKALLADAGYPDGFKSVIHSPEGRYPMDRQVCEVIQAMLMEIGIDAQIQVLDWGAMQEVIENDSTESRMFLMGKGSQTGDVDYGLTYNFRSGNAMNCTQLADDEVDRMLAEERMTIDPVAREKILYDLQVRINDLAPQACLYYENQTFAHRSDVEGFILYPNEMMKLAWLTR
jgi:peptide/nickel transport system substrate-binding protein